MATLTTTHTGWAAIETGKNTTTIWSKWLALADAQSENKTLWFLLSLVVQGVFFLPVPALLIFNFNAPVLILGITLGLFFANIIAGMGGSSIRTMLSWFAASVLIHIAMVLIYTL